MSGWMDMIMKSGGTNGGGSDSSGTQQQYIDQTAESTGNILGNLSAYDQYKNNARLMKDYKKNALRESENTAALRRNEYAHLAGSQKAGIGASGVDVNEGSAVQALAATDAEGEVGAKLIEHDGKMNALTWETREKSAKQKQRTALINAYVTATDIWQKSGQQKFWDGYRSSGGTRTLGDM